MPSRITSPLIRFRPYVAQLELLIQSQADEPQKEALAAALDGQPAEKLRDSVRKDFLRKTGTFFTGKALAARLLCRHNSSIKGPVIDPACGVGDLLVAHARRLDVKKDFESTLTDWGTRIIGCDLHSEFVEATKLRLCLLAHARGLTPCKKINIQSIFPNIVVADGLRFSPQSALNGAVMNPPYTWEQAPDDCTWATGNVCSAALFVDRWISLLQGGSKLKAILPDVLRTGTNYQAWRQTILQRARIDRLEIVGRFSSSVDVDVFLLELTVDPARRTGNGDHWQWAIKTPTKEIISDYFSVQVGRVVPHRDQMDGPQRAYLHSRTAPRWGTIRRIKEQIRSKKPGFSPPFVVVRRTSSPSDKNRAVGTIILGARRVAVENHLMVLIPRANSLTSCQDLIKVLRSTKTNSWLNNRIRCRHLTVSALKNIPWWRD